MAENTARNIARAQMDNIDGRNGLWQLRLHSWDIYCGSEGHGRMDGRPRESARWVGHGVHMASLIALIYTT